MTTISRAAPKAQPLRFGGPVLPVLPRAPLPRFHVPWAGVPTNCPLHSSGGQCSTPDRRRNWPTHREPHWPRLLVRAAGSLFAMRYEFTKIHDRLYRLGPKEDASMSDKYEELAKAVKGLLDCRHATERTHEEAYDFTFKSGPHRDFWDKLIELTGWGPSQTPQHEDEDD